MSMPIPRKPKYFQRFKIPGENIFIKSIQKFFTFIFANRGLSRDEIEGEKKPLSDNESYWAKPHGQRIGS